MTLHAAPLVVTLAAGRGTRLDMGATTPKCLASLAGRPLLDWQRDAFARAGLQRRLLAVRACAAPDPVAEEQLLLVDGSGGPMDSLFALDPTHAQGGVLACYGDIVFADRVLSAVLGCSGDIVVAADRAWESLWRARFGEGLLQDAERFRSVGSAIVEIGGRARALRDIQAQFLGLVKLSGAGFETLLRLRSPDDDATTLLARAIGAGVPVTAAFVDGGWCEVDSASDLACYHRQLAQGGWTHDWRQH